MSEYHISSLVVHCAANNALQVKQQIEQLPGAEVPMQNDIGKLVVLVEGESREALLATFDCIKQLSGVLAATLVFHQVEENLNLLAETL